MGISCQGCGSSNRAGRRFCGQCGAPIAAACARCAFVNQPDEQFCGGCGVRLAPAAALAATPGELRQVVVVFADLADYTRLSGRLAPEDTHLLLGRFFDVVDGAVAEHGGTIDKHIGDNVMALFGAPIAHGNDAERAVRAAFAMHERVGSLGDELSLALRLSIGIAAGQVMASGLGSAHHREYTVIGSSVNLAARLQGRADAGETLVDDGVYRPIEAMVDAERIDDLALKGIDVPVRAWRLTAVRAAPTGHRRPLVGRAAEIARVTDAIGACCDGHRGEVVVLSGEAGIGKSRIAAEAESVARRHGLRTHRLGFVDFGGSRREVGELVDDLVDTAWLDSARAADAHLYTALLDVLGRELPPEQRARFFALDPTARTDARRDAVASAVADAGRTAPRLIVIEDLHWCSGEELPLVAGLAQASRTGAVSVVITTRPDPVLLADDGPWRAALRGVPTVELEVPPLDPGDAEALVASLGAASGLARRAVERAGGNPLFLEELIAAADDHLDAGALPGTVQSLVLARLDRLPPPDRAAVQIASVLGLEFTLDALRAMLDDDAYAPALLLERGLLADRDDELAFRHALLRDGAYASLPRPRKRELHVRAARLLGATDPLLRARHLDFAGDDDAAAAYLEAATVETEERRLEAAVELLDRARELAGDDLRAAIELARGARLLDLGASRDAIDAYRAAAGAATDHRDRARAAIGEAAAHRALSAYAPGLDALATAERALGDAADGDPERAQIHYHRAALHFATSDFDASWSDARRAHELAEHGDDPALRARALSALGDAVFATGNLLDAQDAFERTVALCEAHQLTRFSIANRVMLGQTHMWRGELEPARRLTERALADSLDIRFRFGEMFARHSRALVLQFAGDREGAHREVSASLELSRELGSIRFECEFLTQLAELDFEAGRDSLGDVRACLALTRERGVLGYCGPWTLGLLARLTDDADERRTSIAEGEALLAHGSMWPNFIFFHRHAAHAFAAAADPGASAEHARRCLEAIDAYRALMFREEVEAIARKMA